MLTIPPASSNGYCWRRCYNSDSRRVATLKEQREIKELIVCNTVGDSLVVQSQQCLRYFHPYKAVPAGITGLALLSVTLLISPREVEATCPTCFMLAVPTSPDAKDLFPTKDRCILFHNLKTDLLASSHST